MKQTRKPIPIPKPILEKLRKNQEIMANLQNQASLIVKGDNDVKDTMLSMLNIPADEPHQFDLQNGVINFQGKPDTEPPTEAVPSEPKPKK